MEQFNLPFYRREQEAAEFTQRVLGEISLSHVLSVKFWCQMRLFKKEIEPFTKEPG